MGAASDKPDEMASGTLRSAAMEIAKNVLVLQRRADGDLLRTKQSLEERTAQLQTANAEMELLIQAVSHDMRAPLQHVIGFTDLLNRHVGPTLSPEHQAYLTKILRAAKRTSTLIDDLQTFSSFIRPELRITLVHLDDLVRETSNECQARVPNRKILWTIHPLPPVWADRALLQKVLIQLLANAIKFSGARAECRIEVGCVPTAEDETTVFIRDNGAGFNPRYAQKLFGVFQRLHRQEEFDGNGIGLANVRRIIQGHGGRVWAEGKVERGAIFYFSLPKHRSRSHEQTILHAVDNLRVDRSSVDAHSKALERTKIDRPTPAPSIVQQTEPIKVLVIEDSENDAELALEALREAGISASHRCVQTAAALRTALANERWDAIISDFALPTLTGMEALQIFRSTGLDIPFILMSGTIGEAIAVDAMKGGASDYIMKSSMARLAPALKRELQETETRAAHRQARHDLYVSEERFRALTALSSDWYWEQDENLCFTYVSDGPRDRYSEALELWAGKTRWELPYRDANWDEHRALLQARQSFRDFELETARKDGTIVYVSLSGEPQFDMEGKFQGYRGVGQDITERREAQDRVMQLNRLYSMVGGVNALVVRAPDRNELFAKACEIAVGHGQFDKAWVGVVDRKEERIIPLAFAGMSDGAIADLQSLFASTDGGLQGTTLAARAVRDRMPIVSNDVQNDEQLAFGKKYAADGIRSLAIFPLIVSDQATGVLVLHTSKREFFDTEGLKLLTEVAGNIAFAIDHHAKQERLDYLAYYDPLTGLANRRLFLDRMAQHMRSAVAGGYELALFLVDLERFRSFNDSLGRSAGDTLLVLVAEWLIENAGDASFLARVDSDHFAMILPRISRERDLIRLIEKMAEAFLCHPFRLNDIDYRIAGKVGIAIFPEDGADADTLFKNAEAALKKAKVGGDRYLFYAEKMTATVAGSLSMENQLRQALNKEQFVLHYQPKLNVVDGSLTGAEALIRWNDPKTGLIPPAKFIPILENTGLIHEVGRWALRKAVEDYLHWLRVGLPAVRIAVNVSPLQLRNRNFVAEVEKAISVDPNAGAGLELEITESLIMEDVSRSVSSLQSIRDMGVSIAIDDFGTGFSSLNYLSKLPVDTLKIDRSFVTDICARPQALSLVSVIIDLAHSLKLKVVAEGVETEGQLLHLRAAHCDEMQGFLFSQALPREIFEMRYLRVDSVAVGTALRPKT